MTMMTVVVIRVGRLCKFTESNDLSPVHAAI